MGRGIIMMKNYKITNNRTFPIDFAEFSLKPSFATHQILQLYNLYYFIGAKAETSWKSRGKKETVLVITNQFYVSEETSHINTLS